MKHERYKELLELNVLGELTEPEEIELQNHLFECNECSEEYARIKKMYSVVTANKIILPTDNDLINARKRLFNTIDSETAEEVLTQKSESIFDRIFVKKYRIAFGSFALILIGFIAGYILFNSFNPTPKLIADNIVDLDKIEKGDIKISSISFPGKFSKNGEYGFTLGDENPISYKGNLNDVIVQKLLANTLVETSNPGYKIRTVNSIARQTNKSFIPDPQIKKALISSLKNDKNPGVRKGALNALVNFPFETDIRDALLYTLEHDENASNRIDAINVLLAMNYNSAAIDNDTRSRIELGIQKEDNEVIKFKTTKLLIGGK